MVDITRIVNEIQEKYKIIGRTEELRKIVLAHAVGKNILLEGNVGVGKTTLAKAIAEYYGSNDSNFYRVDCSEELLPHNLVGYFEPPLVIAKGYIEDSYRYGPLALAMMNGGCLFINEINRMPESTQNSLLTSLDEGILEIAKLKTIKAHDDFFVTATQNPAAHVGVTVLGEALKDRFIWVNLPYQTSEEEILIIKQEANLNSESRDKIAIISQNIIQVTRESTSIRRGSSIRGAIDLATLINQYSNSNSSKNWIEAAVMALYNKIELEDGLTQSKKEIITNIVLAVLNKSDFQ
ncbi:MAG: MoxR family ATPase [Candidatus Lokiarchaeota archaeon]|nr:MoxR family ATPase [Candidatus Lokiarchaeota archaeon]